MASESWNGNFIFKSLTHLIKLNAEKLALHASSTSWLSPGNGSESAFSKCLDTLMVSFQQPFIHSLTHSFIHFLPLKPSFWGLSASQPTANQTSSHRTKKRNSVPLRRSPRPLSLNSLHSRRPYLPWFTERLRSWLLFLPSFTKSQELTTGSWSVSHRHVHTSVPMLLSHAHASHRGVVTVTTSPAPPPPHLLCYGPSDL